MSMFKVFVFILLFCNPANKGPSDLVKVSSPKNIPTEKDTLQVVDEISIKTNLYIWQDRMPKGYIGPPKKGAERNAPLFLTLDIALKNNSKKKIKNFRAEKITLFYDKTKKEFKTFMLTKVNENSLKTEINPLDSTEFNFTNDRRYAFSPKIEKEERFYARLLLSWNGKKKIISTSPVVVNFVY